MESTKFHVFFSSLAVGWDGRCGAATTKGLVSSRMNYR
jgi:hypothetical protein